MRRFCRVCGSHLVARDYLYGYLVCQSCGAVVEEQAIDDDPSVDGGSWARVAEAELADALAVLRAALKAGVDFEKAVRLAAASSGVRPARIRRLASSYRG